MSDIEFDLERHLRDAGVWATVYTNNGAICLRMEPVDAGKLRDALRKLNDADGPRLAR